MNRVYSSFLTINRVHIFKFIELLMSNKQFFNFFNEFVNFQFVNYLLNMLFLYMKNVQKFEIMNGNWACSS